jgi:hypothetical protein
MSESAIVEGLLKGMGQAAKAAKFCVDGCVKRYEADCRLLSALPKPG